VPDLETATAGELASAVRARRASALELCDAAIARIERLDGAINAVVVRDFERARAAARQCDEAVARGESGALLGVPMTVKESYDVAGLATTWGLLPFRDFRATEDAVLVTRLKAAGAIILGKTNVPPGLADWQSANPIYGVTRHPADRTRTPGGSSGGSAAALAAGMVPLELGSDIGGSIRVPAHFCGVFGHKPSFDLLPMRGHAPPRADGAGVDLSVCGPLARGAADLELALGVLAGPDLDDATGYRLDLPGPRLPYLKGTRVLVLGSLGDVHVAASVRDALARLTDDLVREGVDIADSTSLLPDLAAAHKAYLGMLMSITTRGVPGVTDVISVHEWFLLLDRRARVRRQWRALFAEFDLVLAPPFGTTAFPLTDEPDWHKRSLMIDGQATPFGDQLVWSGMATFAGLPATVAPIGQDAQGLPIGVQIIGGFLQDRSTIAFARHVEALRG
jgi:amidase